MISTPTAVMVPSMERATRRMGSCPQKAQASTTPASQAMGMARVEGQRKPAMRIKAIRIGMKARNAKRPMDMRPPLQVSMMNMSRPHIFAPHAAVTYPKPAA